MGPLQAAAEVKREVVGWMAARLDQEPREARDRDGRG